MGADASATPRQIANAVDTPVKSVLACRCIPSTISLGDTIGFPVASASCRAGLAIGRSSSRTRMRANQPLWAIQRWQLEAAAHRTTPTAQTEHRSPHERIRRSERSAPQLTPPPRSRNERGASRPVERDEPSDNDGDATSSDRSDNAGWWSRVSGKTSPTVPGRGDTETRRPPTSCLRPERRTTGTRGVPQGGTCRLI
jgi:hypothetical protein